MDSIIHDLIKALFSALLGYLLRVTVKTDWEKTGLILSGFTKYRNTRVRLSISYLFRIRIDGMYLLVRGTRIRHQFQPVGGVFKRLPESTAFFNELDVRDDDNIPIDDISRDDLRINMKGKYLNKFMRWYKDGAGRENSVFREFHEELLTSGILNRDLFPYINYRYIKQRRTKVRFAPHFQMNEVIIAEIYELIPNEQQRQDLIRTMNTVSDSYTWVDAETINRLGANKEIVISPTANWIL